MNQKRKIRNICPYINWYAGWKLSTHLFLQLILVISEDHCISHTLKKNHKKHSNISISHLINQVRSVLPRKCKAFTHQKYVKACKIIMTYALRTSIVTFFPEVSTGKLHLCFKYVTRQPSTLILFNENIWSHLIGLKYRL